MLQWIIYTLYFLKVCGNFQYWLQKGLLCLNKGGRLCSDRYQLKQGNCCFTGLGRWLKCVDLPTTSYLCWSVARSGGGFVEAAIMRSGRKGTFVSLCNTSVSQCLQIDTESCSMDRKMQKLLEWKFYLLITMQVDVLEKTKEWTILY